MAEILHLTDSLIRNMPKAKKEREYYRDDKVKGLLLQITRKGTKSFYVQKSFNGVTNRFFVGNCDVMNVSEAREKAEEMKVNLSHGINPNIPQVVHLKDYTLGEIYQKYLEEKELRDKTVEDYQRLWKQYLIKTIGNKRLCDITGQMIKDMHKKLSIRAPYSANRMLCLVKALFNFAIREELYDKANPALVVRKNKEEHRTRYLTTDELQHFFKGIKNIPEASTRDALLIMIFTGVRKSNVLAMRWEDLDLVSKVWKIPQTKTAKNVTVPLADSVTEILTERRQANQGSPWVFHSNQSKCGHLINIDRAWRSFVRKNGFTNLRVHDLRHTMGTYLAANGASATTIQRALTHKSFQSTQVYVNLDVEHIRPDVNKTVESMIQLGNV